MFVRPGKSFNLINCCWTDKLEEDVRTYLSYRETVLLENCTDIHESYLANTSFPGLEEMIAKLIYIHSSPIKMYRLLKQKLIKCFGVKIKKILHHPNPESVPRS